MSKESGPSEYVVLVDGVGEFTFRRRSMRTQIAIECEYTRLTEGMPSVTAFLGKLATSVSDLKVLTVSAPAGWDPDELDGFDEADYAKLQKVWSALRDKEAGFRKGPAPGGEESREGDGGDVRAVVPQDVPPTAD